jgi:general secretion pathway protein G
MKFSPNAPQTRSAGFTLMEMMLVLLIITLIMGGAALMFQNFSNNAEVVTTRTKVRSLEASLMSYRTNNIYYPTQQQGLEALVAPPSMEPRPKIWKQLVKPDALMDPWQRKMGYRNPGKHNTSGVDVFSFGEDGVEGTNDDIGNW